MSVMCRECGYLKEDCACRNITLVFVDGATMTYRVNGTLVALTDSDGKAEDPSNYSNGVGQDIVGLWHSEDKITIDWEDVVDQLDSMAQYIKTPSLLYIDNGQVVDEGLVVNILVDGVSILDGINGGCDTSGWEGNNNVYCDGCEQQYEVHGVNILMCCHCGSEDIHVKEDIGKAQSEMAKGYSDYIRRTAPWIIGGDE